MGNVSYFGLSLPEVATSWWSFSRFVRTNLPQQLQQLIHQVVAVCLSDVLFDDQQIVSLQLIASL